MKNLIEFSEFINESASIIYLKDMIDHLSKADSDLDLVKDENALQIKKVFSVAFNRIESYITKNTNTINILNKITASYTKVKKSSTY